MTTDAIKLMHAEWLKRFEVPPGLDRRSRQIREQARERIVDQGGGWEAMDRPDFGWTMAMQFAWQEWHTDLLAEAPYRWLRHAAALLGRPGFEHGYDPDLLAVHQAMRIDGEPDVRRLLNATLLATDATVERVANALNFSIPAVEAYAALFFGVLDRKEDPEFRHLAARIGTLNQKGMLAPKELDPAKGAIFVTALKGTVADVVAMWRRDGTVPALRAPSSIGGSVQLPAVVPPSLVPQQTFMSSVAMVQ